MSIVYTFVPYYHPRTKQYMALIILSIITRIHLRHYKLFTLAAL